MPVNALTLKYKGLVHSIITDAEISDAFDPANPPQSLPQRIGFKALWDTGATGTVISENAVNQLNLTPTGSIWVQFGGSRELRNTYVINVYLPSSVVIIGLQATDYPTITGHDMIIGMDIMTKGDFSITNVNKKTCMSFRIPSINEIDYVLEINRAKYSGTGRNDPCPCGKTNENGIPIKYKKCHWAEYR